jgi:S1-C subfamily serine protease
MLSAPANADIVTTTENTGVILEDSSQNAFCSGTVIATAGTEELVATAGHCWDTDPEHGAIPYDVRFFDGDVGIVQAHQVDERADLMLLIVHSMRRHQHAELTLAPVRRNDSLYTFGMPLADYWSFARAYSSTGTDQTRNVLWPDAILLDCTACNYGSSGGGVFNTKGQLVGVVVAFNHANILGHMLAETTKSLVEFMSRVLK